MRKLEDLDLDHANVLVRVDFNVPFDAQGRILDDTRLTTVLPTLEYLLKKNTRLILLSHLGRPKKPDPTLSLKKILPALEALIKQPIHFIEDLKTAASQINQLPFPSITLIENLRFNPAEETPSLDPLFAKNLSTLGDAYIDEAFACAHRDHSSITHLARYFPHKKAPGFLFRREVEELTKILNPKHPFHLLLGGAKISTKLGVINALLDRTEALFIGGAMAFPFMQALGFNLGSVEINPEAINQAHTIIELTNAAHKPLHLPCDWVCGTTPTSTTPAKTFTLNSGIDPHYQPFDIGAQTITEWKKHLKKAQTLFWNGPLGMYEAPPFDQGTAAMAKIISTLSCTSVVGGGDSVAAIKQQGLTTAFSHLSTGGGASLEFLEQGTLPGLEALIC